LAISSRPSLKGVRKLNGLNRQSTALLDHDDVDETSGESYRSSRLGDRLSDRQMPVPKRVLPRVTADDYGDQDEAPFLRSQTRIRVRRGLIPESLWGRILAGTGLFLAISAMVAGLVMVRLFLLHDPRFLIGSSSNIQINGNSHVNRPQLLSVFGEDIGRNVFYVPLAERRRELETLPWVEHATVMRLLPDRLRVSVVERTPVAFVRQDGRIGLVDAYGVLLDLPDDDPAGGQYSFPVLTGIAAADPLSTRAARMKIYQQFMADLDSSGPKLSETLSEVDIANPEDVKALIPEHSSEILVHFGDEDFLERYQRFQQQLPAWQAQYPNLSSVDMRYPNQVVLDMTPGTDASATVPNANGVPPPAATTVSVPAVTPPPAPVADPNSGKKSAAIPIAAAPVATPTVKSAPVGAKPVPAATKPVAVVSKPAPVAAKAAPAPAKSALIGTTPVMKQPAAKTAGPAPAVQAATKMPAPKKLGIAPTAVAPSGPKPAAAVLPGTQTPLVTTSKYNTQYPLMQSFAVPAKKAGAKNGAKAKPAKAKTKAKAKPVMVKSKAKVPAPMKPAPGKPTPATTE
jgi:cell division protein FtsQ